MLLTDALDEYVAVRLVGCAPNTTRCMGDAVRALHKCLGRPPLVSDLTDNGLSAFARWRLDQDMARATIQQNQNKLLALWRWLADEHIVPRRPNIKAITVPERTPKAWTREELDKLFAAIRTTEGKIGAVPAALWWEALHAVLWNTGERIEAILKCKWSDLDVAGCYLHCRAEYRKFAKRDIMYQLLPDTVRLIEQFPERKGVIFHWPLCRTLLYSKYKRILRRAGLPTGREAMFHCMRRSVASHIKAAGGDATAAMDHSSSAVTRGYIDPRIASAPKPCELLFKIA